MAEPQGALEADDYENDSALGGEYAGSANTSVNSSVLNNREENGRTYHSYKDGKYAFPNDEPERDRLDLQHKHFFLTFDGKLFTAPIPEEKQLHRVLDIGTGTGIWAIDFADSHPESQVVGIDLSPIQPSFIPPNLKFEVDDLEEPWTFSGKFDFIYSRMMTGSFSNWSRFFQQSFENMSPGGFIELVDIRYPFEVDDDSLPANSALLKWANLILESSKKAGTPMNSAESYKTQLEAAGFTNVVEVQHKWPQNYWPKQRKYKELGIWMLENSTSGLESFSMALFTRVLNWSKEEVDVFLVSVRKEMKDPKIHAYWPIYVVYGQKPVVKAA